MVAVTYEKGKWIELGKELEVIIRKNNSKPKEERKALTKIFEEFAETNNTTYNSASRYYYNEIKSRIEGNPLSTINIDESIESFANSEVKDPRNVYKIGDVIEVEIMSIHDFGVFAKTKEGFEGLIHISEITGRQYVDLPEDYFYVGEKVKVKVKRLDYEGKMNFSTRAIGGKEKINPAFKDIIKTNVSSITQAIEKKTEPKILKIEPQVEKIEEIKSYSHPSDRDNIITFIKKYSDNNVSQKALSDIDEMFEKYGVFQTTMSLMEAVRDLDISSFITRITKEKLESECLRRD